ncbi:MAG: hypothetical protein JXA46_17410 [Dehalococcoidales bacterium]|nr:hypothetical protein [Dehalococcoidales bacterium]
MKINKAWLFAVTALILLAMTGCIKKESVSPGSTAITSTGVSESTPASTQTSASAAMLTTTPPAITQTITSSATSTPEIKTIVIDKPVPATYATYHDPNGLFTISYPSDWEILQDSKKQIAEGSNQVLEFLNGTNKSKISGIPLFSALNKQPFAVVHLGFSANELYPTPGYTNENFSIYKTIIDSHDAILVECDGWNPDAGKFTVLSIKIILNKNAWQIQCSARPEDYEKVVDDFRSIAGSLRILK